MDTNREVVRLAPSCAFSLDSREKAVTGDGAKIGREKGRVVHSLLDGLQWSAVGMAFKGVSMSCVYKGLGGAPLVT